MQNSLEEVLEYRKKRFEKSLSMVERKGQEYCGKQQAQGDSLFNYRIHFLLGWTDDEGEYPLGRALEKLQRLRSMIDNIMIDDKKFEEDVDDIHNIIDYVALMRRTNRRTVKAQLDPLIGIGEEVRHSPYCSSLRGEETELEKAAMSGPGSHMHQASLGSNACRICGKLLG